MMRARKLSVQSNQYGLPITVGVTGHRDLKNPDVMMQEVSRQMEALEIQFPHTPFVVISALAEGADRYVAKEGLRRGWGLHVILPFAKELYYEDFGDQASIAEFDELCARAVTCSTVRLVIPGSEDKLAGEVGQDYRDLQYAEAGFQLARRSHVLMALWDGKPALGCGGTGEVVRYREHGNLQLEGKNLSIREMELREALLPTQPFYQPESGLVCKIFSERNRAGGNVCAGKKLGDVEWTDGPNKPPVKDLKDLFQLSGHDRKTAHNNIKTTDSLKKIEENNRDIYFFTQKNHKNITKESNNEQKVFTTCYILDHLVTNKTNRMRFKTAFIFIIMGIGLLVNSRAPEDSDGWVAFSLVGTIIILLVLAIFIFGMKWQGTDPKNIYRRAMVEGLRIQGYWNVIGLKESVFLKYMRSDGGIMKNVRCALQGVSFCNDDVPDFKNKVELIKADWVQGQIGYYSKKIRFLERKTKQFEIGSRYSLIIGISLLSVSVVNAVIHHYYEDMMHSTIFRHGIIFNYIDHFSEIFTGFSALLASYLKFSSDSDNLQDYKQALALFNRADTELSNILDSYDRSKTKEDQHYKMYQVGCIFRSLGVAVLNGENARWIERAIKQKIEYGLGG